MTSGVLALSTPHGRATAGDVFVSPFLNFQARQPLANIGLTERMAGRSDDPDHPDERERLQAGPGRL